MAKASTLLGTQGNPLHPCKTCETSLACESNPFLLQPFCCGTAIFHCNQMPAVGKETLSEESECPSEALGDDSDVTNLSHLSTVIEDIDEPELKIFEAHWQGWWDQFCQFQCNLWLWHNALWVTQKQEKDTNGFTTFFVIGKPRQLSECLRKHTLKHSWGCCHLWCSKMEGPFGTDQPHPSFQESNNESQS